MNDKLADTIIIRAMPGTRKRAQKFLRSFKGRFSNESAIYRSAIFRYLNQLDVEKFEYDSQREHDKRTKKVRR